MKIRLMSGTVYIALLVTFYLLKIFVHDLCFDVLIYAFALVGTYEMIRAMGERMTKAERVIVTSFAVVSIPVCAVMEQFLRVGLHVTFILFFAMTVALICLLVVRYDETTMENVGVSFFVAAYPVMLLSLLTLTNHVDLAVMDDILPVLTEYAFNSDLLILFIFVVSPCADSFAYLFGRFMKKRFPKKLAPKISPNKTVIGGIGRLVGGLLSGLILYFAYNGIVVGHYNDMGVWLPIYLVTGLIAAAFTEFGDLVESCIKRKVGIKDMGKIMPGHGGIMDRIDGTLFAALAVYLVFTVVWKFSYLL